MLADSLILCQSLQSRRYLIELRGTALTACVPDDRPIWRAIRRYIRYVRQSGRRWAPDAPAQVDYL